MYNDGVEYLLTVIDIFSKYGWVLSLKNKTGLGVASVLEKVFKNENQTNCGSIKVSSFTAVTYKNSFHCTARTMKKSLAL